MLLNLTIKNFAIIKELNVDFANGLNLITGETGVGKSIIVNAVKLLIGGKFSKEYFRTGEEKCILEGTFIDGNKKNIIRRIFSLNSASRSFLNDEPISIEKLKIATKYFVDLHGQHDQQRLLDPAQHIEYLDSWGDYNEELIKLSELYSDLNRYTSKLKTFVKNEKQILEKEELYQFQLQEINLFELTVGEESDLQESFRVLQNSSALKESISNILEIADNNNPSVRTGLVQIEKLLN
ncbi:MAG: AAA family ATPase, partial [Fidelibacterota bacterium]